MQAIDLYRGQPLAHPMLLEGAFLDSLYAMRPGTVIGPRPAQDSLFVVRIDRIDPAFVPPYEAVRQAANANAQLARRWALEKEAASYYEAHKDDFKTKPEWVFDYVYFRRPHADSVAVPDSAIVGYYRSHPLEFTAPAMASSRIILFQYRPGDGASTREGASARAGRPRPDPEGRGFRCGGQGGLGRPRERRARRRDPAGHEGAPPEGPGGRDLRGAGGEATDVIEARNAFHLVKVEERGVDTLRSRRLASRDPDPPGRADRRLARLPGGRPIPRRDRGRSVVRLAGGRARRRGAERAHAIRRGAARDRAVRERGGHSRAAGGRSHDTEPVPIGNGYLVARRVREVAPAPAPFAEIKERVIADYQMSKRREAADSLDQKFREAVARGADLEPLFDGMGGMRISRPFARSGPIPDFKDRDPRVASDSTLLERIFSSRPGKVLPPTKSALGTIYMIVESVTVPPAADFARHRDHVWRDIVDRRIEAWTARLRARAQVVMYRKELKSLLASG